MTGFVATAALTCWLCSLIAAPRKPRLGNEAAELVYARLLGRQQVLMCCATVVTAMALLTFVATMPRQVEQSRLSAGATCEGPNQQTAACGQPVSSISVGNSVGDAQRQLGALLKQTGGGFTMALDPTTGQPIFR